jgi:hypothetical protein
MLAVWVIEFPLLVLAVAWVIVSLFGVFPCWFVCSLRTTKYSDSLNKLSPRQDSKFINNRLSISLHALLD